MNLTVALILMSAIAIFTGSADAAEISCEVQWDQAYVSDAMHPTYAFGRLEIQHGSDRIQAAWACRAEACVGSKSAWLPTAAEVAPGGVYTYRARHTEGRHYGPDIAKIYFNTWLTESDVTDLTVDPRDASRATVRFSRFRQVTSRYREFREARHVAFRWEAPAKCEIR